MRTLRVTRPQTWIRLVRRTPASSRAWRTAKSLGMIPSQGSSPPLDNGGTTRSVGGAYRLAQVEAPDQLGANRLHPWLEADVGHVGQIGAAAGAVVVARHEVLLLVLCQPIFASPEQAGQPTQVVLEAAADEPSTRAKALV